MNQSKDDSASDYHAFVKGWTDGAKAGPRRDEFMLHVMLKKPYVDGYELGRAARVEAYAKANEMFRHESSVVRSSAEPAI